MRKVIVGLFIVLVAGASGCFGLEYWAARAATREVDAALDRWRASAGPATRGPVTIDLWTRAVRVADVVLASQASPNDKISIAEVVASGVDTSGGASRLEIVGLEMSGAAPGVPGARLRQTSPRITLTGYSGRPPAQRRATSPLDTMRIWLEQFSAITAETIDIPSLTVTVALARAGARPDAPVIAEYTYSNLVLRGVTKGRVAQATADAIALRSNTGRRDFTGEIGKASMTDIDVGPMLAVLDSSRPRGEGYQRVYGRLSAGPYTLRFNDGTGFGIDRIVAEDIGVYPAKLSLDDLLFLTEVGSAAGQPTMPTPGQLSMLVDKLGGLYEAIRLGKLEMQGVHVDTPRDRIDIGGIALNGLDSGRLAELAIEKLEGKTPARAEHLNIGRVSVTGFHLSNLFRGTSMQLAALAAPAQPQDPTQLLRALALLEGVEIANVTVPDPKTGRILHLETLNASWAEFVEGIPTQVRLAARLRVPISANDPEPFMRALAARGTPAMTASLEFGTSWTEATQTVAVTPATLEIGDVLAMSVKAQLGNVPREVFSTNIIKAIGSVALVEAGLIEVTVRDLGAVDQAAAELGRATGGGPEAGRLLLAATLAQNAAPMTQRRPELQPFFDALGQFVQGKGETMTVTLTPKGHVGILPLIDGARRDPLATLLDGFTLDARTGK
jgi:hypothetical protein